MSGNVRENLEKLKVEAAEAAQRAGRKPEEIKIILVSKTVTPERVMEAFKAGARDFGENRAQNLAEKKSLLPGDIRWHMIGQLQTNKVKQVVGNAVLIHSLDRPDLADEINRQAEKRGLESVPCLVQVNAAGEATKAGLAPGDVKNFVQSIRGTRISVRGLMAIGPNTQDEAEIRRVFANVRKLRDDLAKEFPNMEWSTLSMGMSGDYKIAIEEGSTLIRVGSAVFGAREKK